MVQALLPSCQEFMLLRGSPWDKEASSLTSCVTLGSHKFFQLLIAFFLGVTPHQCLGGGVGVLENEVPGRVQWVLGVDRDAHLI